MERRYISRKWLLLLPAALVLVWCWPYASRALRRIGAHEHWTYNSPDRRFQIVVYRMPMIFAMPGQGSDAPGYFQLRDARTGKVLEDQDVEMVQDADLVEWTPSSVSVGILADWRLPQ
jgi:hypothetical protein